MMKNEQHGFFKVFTVVLLLLKVLNFSCSSVISLELSIHFLDRYPCPFRSQMLCANEELSLVGSVQLISAALQV